MINLTAKVKKIGEPSANYMTHIDLCYTGSEVSDDTLITDCVLLDISKSPECINIDDIPSLSLIEVGNSVILKTGWEKYRGTPKYDESPWIDSIFIEHLVKLGVCLILVDSPGVTGGAASTEHSEMDIYLADNKAHAVENLVNLNLINTSKFKLYCFPIYSAEANNAPCRITAETK